MLTSFLSAKNYTPQTSAQLLFAAPVFIAHQAELDPELVLPYLLSRRGRSQDLILALLADAIRDAQRAGDARDGDPVAMARATVLAAHGFVLSAHTMVDAAVSSTALDDELRLLLTRGLS